MEMAEAINTTNSKITRCIHRRLNLQHEIEENLCKQNHLSNLHSYKNQEQLFNRKINHLKKRLAHVEPYDDDINEEHSLMAPNCIARIQNHFRLLNFSSETEKRLLCQTSSPNQFSQQRNSTPFIPSRPTINYSCRSARNPHSLKSDIFEQKTFQSYRNQQIFDEQQKQLKISKRKTFLLKEFDELKHTIDDPYAAFSVLAALSRAFLLIDSGTE
jgi:hypothetical protein